MEQYIAFDSHKHYTWVEHEQAPSGKVRQYRVEHAPGSSCDALDTRHLSARNDILRHLTFGCLLSTVNCFLSTVFQTCAS